MSTKVYVSKYVEGPMPPALPQITLGRGDWGQLVRHCCALLSPRLQWRTCRQWFLLEAAVLASMIATAIAFLTTTGGPTRWLLVIVDAVLLISAAAALSTYGLMAYLRKRKAQLPRLISPFAFRLANEELCRSLRQAGNVDIEDCASGSNLHRLEAIPPANLQPGDVILVEAGQFIYVNGVILAGAAVIDESAVTGRSMYVLREAGGDCEVTHDTLVVTGRILVEVTPRLGHPLDWITGTGSQSQVNTFELKSGKK